MLTHRIMRAAIPFGPEVMPGETRTAHSRGLMFVCYQASIARQFEYIQSRRRTTLSLSAARCAPTTAPPATWASTRSSDRPPTGVCAMDEPTPNYPFGNRRTRLDMAEQFVVLTAAAYFLCPR